jgi:orotidine-5'-phosphate decarboxylase
VNAASPVAISHPADRLLGRIDARRAPVCVGLDPVLERLPLALRPADPADPGAVAAAIEGFCLGVVDAVAEHVPAIKPQSACFERYGWRGVRVLETVIARARERGLEGLLDVKRGDIGTTAAHYGAAARAAGADWATASPYLGVDGIEPMLAAGLGVFALVRTSNPGGDRLQSLPAGTDGGTLADAVADLVAEAGRASVGDRGYSSLGAVVGATKPRDAARLRSRMPQQIFLVPGYGAQGGGVDDVLPCFDAAGRGAVVTASRSVLYPTPAEDPAWATAVGDAAAELAETIGRATGAR